MNFSIKDAQIKLQKGDITSVELVQSSLQVIEKHQADSGVAFTKVNADSALAQAKVSDARIAMGDSAPLLGLPISIKDSMDHKGEITTAGSRIFSKNGEATHDADAVALVKKAGGIIVGRTNMSEFAFSGLGVNPHYGTPVHPVRSEYVAGGSTSGGAVSVALGSVFAALGSDTGGSLRIPAAFCDVVGFKPTASRVSGKGVVPLSYTYDSIGAITKSVDDCIVMDQILANEQYEIPEISLSQMCFFVTDDYVMEDLDPEVKHQFLQTLEKLEAHGATIIYGAFKELSQIPIINSKGGLTAAEIWCEHELFFTTLKEYYDPLVAQRIERGQKITAAEYLNVMKARDSMIAKAQKKLAFFDAWLMPTVSVKPPKLEELAQEEAFFRFNNAVLRNTTVTNFLDGCAISLPLGDGMGLTIAGLHNSDQQILTVAKSIETALEKS